MSALHLHTAARWRAMDRSGAWSTEYQNSGAADRPSSAEARNLFPRYLAQGAILEAVERVNPGTLPDLSTARDLLVSLVLAAENRATAHLTGSIERAAIAEERHAIADFLRTVDESELASVEPLPYRRVLDDDELTAAWVALSDAWSIGAGYWFPLVETHRPDVAAFQAPYFERDGMPAVIRTTLLGRGVTRVWELREYGPSYELDVEALDPEYTGAEGFWCSPGFEWVVYASHESSITVGGDWLLQAVRDAWTDAEKRRWSWPFF